MSFYSYRSIQGVTKYVRDMYLIDSRHENDERRSYSTTCFITTYTISYATCLPHFHRFLS